MELSSDRHCGVAGLPIALLLSRFFDLKADAAPVPATVESHRPRRPATALMLAVIGLALLAGTAVTAYLTRKAAHDTAVLAVFPFTVRSAGSLSYVGDGKGDPKRPSLRVKPAPIRSCWAASCSWLARCSCQPRCTKSMRRMKTPPRARCVVILRNYSR